MESLTGNLCLPYYWQPWQYHGHKNIDLIYHGQFVELAFRRLLSWKYFSVFLASFSGYAVWKSIQFFNCPDKTKIPNHLSRLMTKPTKWHVRPAKTQISLGIHPVWSESSLSAWRNIGSWATHWVHSEDWSDWAHSHFVGFVMMRLISLQLQNHSCLLTRSYLWHEGIHISRAMRKRVLCHMRTTKAQISLRIRAVWSAPLLFTPWIV